MINSETVAVHTCSNVEYVDIRWLAILTWYGLEKKVRDHRSSESGSQFFYRIDVQMFKSWVLKVSLQSAAFYGSCSWETDRAHPHLPPPPPPSYKARVNTTTFLTHVETVDILLGSHHKGLLGSVRAPQISTHICHSIYIMRSYGIMDLVCFYGEIPSDPILDPAHV